MKTYNKAWFQQVLEDLESSDPLEHYLCWASVTFRTAWETVPWFKTSLVALGDKWIKDKELTGINTPEEASANYLFWTHQSGYHERRITMRQVRKDFLLWLIENNHTIEEPQQQ